MGSAPIVESLAHCPGRRIRMARTILAFEAHSQRCPSRNFNQRNGLVLKAAVYLEIREIDCEYLCFGVLFAQPNYRGVREISLILSHELSNGRQIGDWINPKFPRLEQQTQTFHAGTVFA